MSKQPTSDRAFRVAMGMAAATFVIAALGASVTVRNLLTSDTASGPFVVIAALLLGVGALLALVVAWVFVLLAAGREMPTWWPSRLR